MAARRARDAHVRPCASSETSELFAVRGHAKRWRFYDHFRTDADAAVRGPGLATFTPVLAASGDDLAGALVTIERVGVADTLHAAVDAAFEGSVLELVEDDDATCRIRLRQPGLRRPLGACELSDVTLRVLLLATALLSPGPRAPGAQEPEASLHARLMPALAALVVDAAERSQIVVVTHSPDLVRSLGSDARLIELVKCQGSTTVSGAGLRDQPRWAWPTQ